MVREIAAAHGATPGQVALAWLLAQGDDVVPIPGTKRVRYLEENVGALDVDAHRRRPRPPRRPAARRRPLPGHDMGGTRHPGRSRPMIPPSTPTC